MNMKSKKKKTTSVAAIRPRKIVSRKGPEPERLKIDGNWVDAIDTALAKKRPPDGWPTK